MNDLLIIADSESKIENAAKQLAMQFRLKKIGNRVTTLAVASCGTEIRRNSGSFKTAMSIS